VTPEGEVIIPLDLLAISQGKQPNMHLMADDVIDVRQTLGKKVALGFFDLVKNVFNVGYTINR